MSTATTIGPTAAAHGNHHSPAADPALPPVYEAAMLTREFGLAIRRLREARGWSQERLAEAADMNRS